MNHKKIPDSKETGLNSYVQYKTFSMLQYLALKLPSLTLTFSSKFIEFKVTLSIYYKIIHDPQL
jgi:hypothetical protein